MAHFENGYDVCFVLTREPLPAKKGQDDSSSSYEASTTKEAIAYALFITNLGYLVRQQCLRSSYLGCLLCCLRPYLAVRVGCSSTRPWCVHA